MSAKPGRNDPCPCGSGKQYKKCCIHKEEPPVPLRLLPPEREDSPFSSGMDFHSVDETETEEEEWERNGPRTEFDDWYDIYEASSLEHKLEMIRDLLAQDRPAEYFEDNNFGGILLDLQVEFDKSKEDEWIALVEHIRITRPDVFNLDFAYLVNDLVYHYVGTGQTTAVNSLIEGLVAQGLPPAEMTFELLDLLHVAGLHDAARMLVTHAVSRIDDADLFEWAEDELIGMAAFFPIHDYIEAGCTDAGLVRLKESLAAIDCRPQPDHLARIIAHRVGRAEQQFTWDDFEARNDPDRSNLYLLTLDFGRWLTTDRNMPAITAEAMRRFVNECLVEVSDKKGKHSLDLPPSAIERHVEHMFDFMSPQLTRGAATLVALGHSTEFLKTRELIDKKRYENRSSFWVKLWSRLEPMLDQSPHDYSFLTRWR